MTITIRLVNASITFRVCVVRPLKKYTLSNFRVYDTVLLGPHCTLGAQNLLILELEVGALWLLSFPPIVPGNHHSPESLSLFLYIKGIKRTWQRVCECVCVCMCTPTCTCMCVCFQNMDHYWENQKHSGSIHSHIDCCSEELRLDGSASRTLVLLDQSVGVVKSIMNSMSSELSVQVQILPFVCFVDMMTSH